MKKIAITAGILVIAGLGCMNFAGARSVAAVSSAANLINEGKVYITTDALSVNRQCVLAAVEEKNVEYRFFDRYQELFITSVENCAGFPPSKFTIRGGEPYQLERAEKWGTQDLSQISL